MKIGILQERYDSVSCRDKKLAFSGVVGRSADKQAFDEVQNAYEYHDWGAKV